MACMYVFLCMLIPLTSASDKLTSSRQLQHTYSSPRIHVVSHQVPADSFAQTIQVKVFLPADYPSTDRRLPSLYINDGQDADAIALAEILQKLYDEKKIRPIIVIAVSMLPDRMATYGFSDRQAKLSLPAETRYGFVGLRAHDYSAWLAESLVPFIDAQYRTIANSESRSILGWSLGAASAFNISWNYPDRFGVVGGFSSSFWLSKSSNDSSTQMVQQIIASKPLPEYFKVWLAVGDAEETDDRDNDGVIDVIDDSQAVIEAISAKVMLSGNATTQHELKLTIFPDGQHNQQTWKQMLPEFLIWAYPLENTNRK